MSEQTSQPTEDEHPGDASAFPAGLAVGVDGGLFVSTEVAGCGGLTKRELFAAMALQGMLANPSHADHLHSHGGRAALAILAADALLKELARG